METENNSNEVLVEAQKSPLYCVTPLSKYLALTLFIILPFLGGWIGYSLAPVKTLGVKDTIMTKSSVDEKNINIVPENSLSVSDIDTTMWIDYSTSSSNYDFSLKYPPSWSITERKESISIFNPATAQPSEGGYASYTNVEIKSGNLAECLWSSGSQIRSEISGGMILDNGWEGWLGGKGRLICVSTRQGDQYSILFYSNNDYDPEGQIELDKIFSTLAF